MGKRHYDLPFRILIIGLAAVALQLAITQAWSLIWTLALLPGIIGLANIAVILRHRAIAAPASASPQEDEHAPKYAEAVVAAILLTAVFCIVAANHDNTQMQGLVYAGYGAYVSTLWLMIVRLNASVLSPRFLVNSAIKSAIALMIGYVAGTTPLFKMQGLALFFLVGLFLSSALNSLKRTAFATFGVTSPSYTDVSVRILDGVDEDAASVLEEMGVTSVQHLATMCPAEVCGRSLYPRERVFDWIDQAILAVHTAGRLTELRAIGIRTAHNLIAIAEKEHVMESAATQIDVATRRMGLPEGGLALVVECIRQDRTYLALKALRAAHVIAVPQRSRLRPADRSIVVLL